MKRFLLLSFIVFSPTVSFYPSLSLSAVKEIDLALWRSAEAIANDKGEFMNDGEWELLSIPSRYWQIHQDNTDYANIQFNVCPSTMYICHIYNRGNSLNMNVKVGQ